MGIVRRVVQAAQEGRLLSGAARHVTETVREMFFRRRLEIPRARRQVHLPSITFSGNFGCCEGRTLQSAFHAAESGDSKLPDAIRSIEGMSGQKYRTLINTLIGSLDCPRYLEIGCWKGSTATAALYGNKATALCVDNWSLFGGPREAFMANINLIRSPTLEFRLIEQDFRQIDFKTVGRFNVYLFDGPHTERDHTDGIVLPQPSLDDPFFLVIDDWNWRRVRLGTMRGLLSTGCKITSAIEVRTRLTKSLRSDWHNGYLIAVVRKSARQQPPDSGQNWMKVEDNVNSYRTQSHLHRK